MRQNLLHIAITATLACVTGAAGATTTVINEDLYARAIAGQVDAQRLIGEHRLAGDTMPKDVPDAAAWLTLASGQGDVAAAMDLANYYLTADGYYSQGRHYLAVAAKAGSKSAQARLSTLPVSPPIKIPPVNIMVPSRISVPMPRIEVATVNLPQIKVIMPALPRAKKPVTLDKPKATLANIPPPTAAQVSSIAISLPDTSAPVAPASAAPEPAPAVANVPSPQTPSPATPAARSTSPTTALLTSQEGIAAQLKESMAQIAVLRTKLEAMEKKSKAVTTAKALNGAALAAFAEGDYETAIPKFKRAANLGNASAMANLGMLYLNGIGVAHNQSFAMSLLQRAAKHGNRTAAENLGRIYEAAIGTQRDTQTAMKWYRRAEKMGSVRALPAIRRLGG